MGLASEFTGGRCWQGNLRRLGCLDGLPAGFTSTGASVRGHHPGNRLAGCCRPGHTMPRQLTGGVAWRWRSVLSHLEVAKLAPGRRKSQSSELRLLSFHLRGRCGLSGLVRRCTCSRICQEPRLGHGCSSGSSAHIWAVPTVIGCSQASLFLLAQPGSVSLIFLQCSLSQAVGIDMIDLPLAFWVSS